MRHSTPPARNLENPGHFREGYFPKRSQETPADLFPGTKEGRAWDHCGTIPTKILQNCDTPKGCGAEFAREQPAQR
jgi:hypothetical protein